LESERRAGFHISSFLLVLENESALGQFFSQLLRRGEVYSLKAELDCSLDVGGGIVDKKAVFSLAANSVKQNMKDVGSGFDLLP
jgi:hypothetical protein